MGGRDRLDGGLVPDRLGYRAVVSPAVTGNSTAPFFPWPGLYRFAAGCLEQELWVKTGNSDRRNRHNPAGEGAGWDKRAGHDGDGRPRVDSASSPRRLRLRESGTNPW
jgi:hypothetical protein